MVWGLSISLYLFLAGLGGGASIFAFLLGQCEPSLSKIRLVGRAIAPVAVAVGLLFLVLDAEAGLENPIRFFYLLTNFQSVMAWGVVILMLFMVTSLVILGIEWAKKEVPRLLDAAGAVFSFGVAAYTGVLLGAAQAAFPLWNCLVVPPLFVVSALSTGFAAVLLGGRVWAKGERMECPILKKTQGGLTVLEVMLVVVLLIVVNGSNSVGAASVASIVVGGFAPTFWILFMVVGLAVPLAIEVWEVVKGGFRGKERAQDLSDVAQRRGNAISLIAWSGTLIGGFALRYLIIAAALPMIPGC